MKINGTNRIEYVNQTYKKNLDKVDKPDKTAENSSQVTIELSKTSQELKKHIEKLNKSDTVDRQRIHAIKQAIQDGSYKVSPEKLAEKILDRILEQTNPEDE